jgi:hypothetical protein
MLGIYHELLIFKNINTMKRQDFINKWIGWVSYSDREKLADEMESDLREIEKELSEDKWIKIEKEEDLPEETGTYFTFSKVWWKPFYRIDVFTGRLKNSFTNGKSCFTHYQPIAKPNLPVT